MRTAILLAILLVAGCRTGTYLLEGRPYPPTDPMVVEILDAVPDGAARIGIVAANPTRSATQISRRSRVDNAVRIAATLGADAVVVIKPYPADRPPYSVIALRLHPKGGK